MCAVCAMPSWRAPRKCRLFEARRAIFRPDQERAELYRIKAVSLRDTISSEGGLDADE